MSPSSGIAGFQTLMVLLVFGYSSLSSICLFQFWHCIPRFLLQRSQTATLAPDFMLPHFYSPWERQTFSEILGSFVIMNRFVLGYMPSMKKNQLITTLDHGNQLSNQFEPRDSDVLIDLGQG